MEDQPPATPEPPYKTAAQLLDVERGTTSSPPKPGLSFSPGLQPVPGSTAPATASGEPVPHVFGPLQTAVDPLAAGIDTEQNPATRAENRVITRTGEAAAGPRPVTYAEKSQDVPQAAPADGANVAAPPDAASDAVPGPSSAPTTSTAVVPAPAAPQSSS